MDNKLITVFTPTYNRAYCLHQLYESLCRQSSHDFLWLIIDDGSTDNTKELVDFWIKEKKIEIQYFFKSNGGMHTAHNAAYELLETELNICIDSDDYMPDNAVEIILEFWMKNKSPRVGGILALDMARDGNIIGTKFPEDLEYFEGWGWKYIYMNGKRYRIKGDKKFIAVTKVLQQYPSIPVFEGEKFYGLYYKQHYIEREYRILLFNEPVCVVEYLPDGSSMNIFKQYMNNPKGFQHMRMHTIKIAPTFDIKFIQTVHYLNSCLIMKDYNFYKKGLNIGIITLALPFGLALYFYTKYMGNKLRRIS